MLHLLPTLALALLPGVLPRDAQPVVAAGNQFALDLWGQKGYAFQRPFLKLLHDCYEAGLGEVDFAASEQARATINGWVEKQTAGKIPDLFGPGVFNSYTRLVLTSAIHFKGDWVSPF